ncbi:MAG: two-component system response regulator [Planctomycetota bacterium]
MGKEIDWAALRVVILDPDGERTSRIHKTLRHQDVRWISSARSTKDALVLLAEGLQDVILMDSSFYNTQGKEFMRILRSPVESPCLRLPVLLLIARPTKDGLQEAIRTGIDHFIAKPFVSKALLDRIELLLKNPPLYMETASYIGPDRRRVPDLKYAGDKRREADEEPTLT